MKYIILVLWTFSLFLLMFSSFPFRVECRPTRAMGPGPPRQGQGTQLQLQLQLAQIHNNPNSYFSSNQHLLTSCPVLEGPSAVRFNPWPDLYRTDITVKVWESPIVLEGTARSRSEVRPDGTFGVTFDLHRVVKGDAPLLRRRKQFRLQFLDNPNPNPEQKDKDKDSLNRNKQLNRNTIYNNSTISSAATSLLKSRINNINNNNVNNYNSHSNSRTSSSASTSSNSNSNSNSNNGAISTRQLHQPQHQLQLYQHQQQSRQLQLLQQQQTAQSRQQQLQQQQQQFQSQQFQQNQRQLQLQNRQQQQQFHQSQQTRQLQYPSPNPTVRVVRNSSLAQPSSAVQLRPYNNNINSNTNRNVGLRRSSRTGRNVPNSFNQRGASSSLNGGGKCLPPKATVKTGRKYYVFAAKVDNHFIAVFSPELANKRNTKALESILCKGCGQAPSVVAAKDVQLKVKERLRLRCRLRAGNPVPLLTWYKDGRPVNLTDTRFRLRPKRRQSILVIRKAKEVDAGVYKCEAKNVFGSAHANVRVSLPSTSSSSRPSTSQPKPNKPSSSKPVGTTPTTLWPLASSECPFDSYCLNGGTCSYYETIGEYVCQCAEGYKGQRCDTKDIPTSGSMYLSYFCIFGTINPDYPC